MKNRTKIVATIGPATNKRDQLLLLAQEGMGVARLNGSHADLEWHRQTISLIREVLPETPILMDIPGRKIRTGLLKREPIFKVGEVIVLTSDMEINTDDRHPVNYPNLHLDLKVGAVILADDGTLRFTVIKVVEKEIHCRAEGAGQLKSRKGINVPYVKLQTTLVTDRDRQMMDFCVQNEVDYVGISFVESAAHVEAIRELTRNGRPRIVAKIENQGGLDHAEEVIRAADGIMIDRGDLSVETNLESVALRQKEILEKAQEQAKPVIVATEMLHSMIGNSFPTKAEVADITNAVLDGCAATMLSGETAVGAYPIEAVRMMRTISSNAEQHQQSRMDLGRARTQSTVPEVMSDAIALICRTLPLTKIVAVTISGYAARMIAARRPRQPILAVSNDPAAARSFQLYFGTQGIYLDVPFSQTSTDHVVKCLELLWRQGKLVEEDLILVTAVGYPKSGNRMNMIETHAVGDLKETLGWSKL